MHSPDFPKASVSNGGSAAQLRPSKYPGRETFAPFRVPLLPMLLALACAAALLLAFQQVVHAGVQKSEARSQVAAAQADAVWRCNYTLGLGQRESCHVQRMASQATNLTEAYFADATEPVDMSLASR